MAANERVSRLRERMLVTPAICVERAYYMTKSYQKTENLPTILRRAHALADILDHMTIRIEEGELIAGWQTSKERVVPCLLRCAVIGLWMSWTRFSAVSGINTNP